MIDDPTFLWRASVGTLVLLALAARDRHRTGSWARLRELGFLFATTAVTMALAVAHDSITWAISPEYFSIGKGIALASRSFFPVARLALQAGWTLGLGLGLVLVVTNNPSTQRSQLTFPALAKHGRQVLTTALVFALALGALAPLFVGAVEAPLIEAGVRHPAAYVLVQAAHLGAHLGLVIGGVRAVIAIRRARAGLPPPLANADRLPDQAARPCDLG